MAYDIFISYRRKGAGAGVAGELQAKLENKGYKVFLDVDDIGSGQFPLQIIKAIEECKDFLLILTPGTLDRCADESDWVRREITTAEQLNKNIIGIMLPGFVMPSSDDLPIPLRNLPSKQVFLWSHEYRNASFAKILENLESAKQKKSRKILKTILFSAIAITILTIAIVMGIPPQSDPIPLPPPGNKEVETLFISHVTNARSLSENLPDATTFGAFFQNYIDSTACFTNLAKAVSEYDEAIALKEKNADLKDPFEVETKRDALIALKSAYMNEIVKDISVFLDAVKQDPQKIDTSIMNYVRQDLEMARIVAEPADNVVLDSLETVYNKIVNR